MFCPKYRRKVLVGDIERDLKRIFEEVAKEHDVQIKAMEIMPDHTNHVANKVDHLAEKIAFAVDMVKNASMSLEAAQQELVAIANAPYPPQSGQLLSLSNRIATCKKQIDDGLLKIQEMAKAIDVETDNIQINPPKAW